MTSQGHGAPPDPGSLFRDPLSAWVAALVGLVVLLLLPRPLLRMLRRFALRIVLEAVAIVTMGLLTGRAADALTEGESDRKAAR